MLCDFSFFGVWKDWKFLTLVVVAGLFSFLECFIMSGIGWPNLLIVPVLY